MRHHGGCEAPGRLLSAGLLSAATEENAARCLERHRGQKRTEEVNRGGPQVLRQEVLDVWRPGEAEQGGTCSHRHVQGLHPGDQGSEGRDRQQDLTLQAQLWRETTPLSTWRDSRLDREEDSSLSSTPA